MICSFHVPGFHAFAIAAPPSYEIPDLVVFFLDIQLRFSYIQLTQKRILIILSFH